MSDHQRLPHPQPHSQPPASAQHPNRLYRICRFCPKGFSKTEHLLRHERSHTKERPFRCETCGKRFSRNDTLLRHNRAHTKGQNDTISTSECGGSPQDLNSTIVDSIQARVLGGHSELSRHDTLNAQQYTESQALNHALLIMSDNQEEGNSSEHEGSLGPMMTQGIQIESQLQPTDLGLSPLLADWDPGSQYPPWQVGDDFDRAAFNSSLFVPMYADETMWKSPPPTLWPVSNVDNPEPVQNLSPSSLDVVKSLWVTTTSDATRKSDASYSLAPTRPASPDSPDNTSPETDRTVDERYRYDLSKRLSARWKEEPLPSTGFLNIALSLFFTRFNPIFPIIHAPTFRPNKHNSLLLLSICSIGCLFMGSNGASAQGSRLFERLNKVILASWEHIIIRETPERTCMIQAAIIGQTFGYLSGNPKHLAIVESFHGTVISWARRDGMFKPSHESPSLDFRAPEELYGAWHDWARAEEKKRTAMGLYIHDSQLASLLHHDPILRHNATPLSIAASNEVFFAPSASQWAKLVRRSPPRETLLREHFHSNQHRDSRPHPLAMEMECSQSQFSCYVILHSIEATVEEAIQTSLEWPDQNSFTKFSDALNCWYLAYGKLYSTREPDTFCVIILWHKIWMSLLVNFNALERAIGRDGHQDASSAQEYVNSWTASAEAKRCIIHASLINRLMGTMQVDAEPAIHVPRCMFQAAIAWYCYVKFSAVVNISYTEAASLDFPEIRALDIIPEQYLFEVSGFQKGKPSVIEASPLCRLTDMLHKVGHWEIARRYARILGLLIHGDTDSHLVDSS